MKAVKASRSANSRWNKLKIIAWIFLAAATGQAFGIATEDIISRIKAADKKVLAQVSQAEMEKVHKYKDTFFYIPRVIGQKAVRSLFGCFDNKSAPVRKICADSLYQLKLNYVHKKFVLHLLKNEKEPPVQMSLQDIIVRMNEERFYAAREQRDGRFLMKITYDELSVIADKGLPASKAFTGTDVIFLMGGLENPDVQVRVFCVKMLGRITGGKSLIRTLLTHQKAKEKSAAVLKEIDISLGCLTDGKNCPDVYLNDSNS
jgi:hypothetical protein